MSCSCITRKNQHIYTDGSKDKGRVGCAVLRENDHQTMRIPDGSSVFTAEANAIDLALDFPRAGSGVERIGRTPPSLAQSVETWPIGVRLVCRELRPVSLEERILVIERVGCGRHATHYFGLNFS